VNRQLTDRERQILDMLLSADFPASRSFVPKPNP